MPKAITSLIKAAFLLGAAFVVVVSLFSGATIMVKMANLVLGLAILVAVYWFNMSVWKAFSKRLENGPVR